MDFTGRRFSPLDTTMTTIMTMTTAIIRTMIMMTMEITVDRGTAHPVPTSLEAVERCRVATSKAVVDSAAVALVADSAAADSTAGE
jgi:ABC-type ATPase involved in cell division